jgi:hypothetical protein
MKNQHCSKVKTFVYKQIIFLNISLFPRSLKRLGTAVVDRHRNIGCVCTLNYLYWKKVNKFM